MWIFRRHRHLNPELLSEYLDGRLGQAARSRVSRQVENCPSCRDELDSLRSAVALLRQLPEVVPSRSFTLAAPPGPRPQIARPPLPLRAPGWAYAGAASLAGLALAIMVSADTLGLLTPIGQADFSLQSSEGADQALEIPADSTQSLRSTEGSTESRPQPTEAGPALAQPPAAPEAETMALAAESGPGAADATGSPDSAIDGDGLSGDALSEKAADALADGANRSTEGPTEGGPGAIPVLTPGQYRDTPLIWRVLEGIATALLLTMLSILVVRRYINRRTGG
jgi:hypothetical protein